ncbi:MAG: hypothetical protein WCG85_21910 [Polyangia bacterium]
MKLLRDSVRWLVRSDGAPAGWRSGLVLLLTAAALMVVRAPVLLVHPRLWAEEGSLYLATSLTLPWWEALFALQWKQDQRYRPKIHPCWDGKCWEVDLAAAGKSR